MIMFKRIAVPMLLVAAAARAQSPAPPDAEIRRIIDEQYHLARRLLEENRDKVESMAKTLLEWETIDADQILDIMEGRPPRPPKSPAPSTASSGSSSPGGGVQEATQPA